MSKTRLEWEPTGTDFEFIASVGEVRVVLWGNANGWRMSSRFSGETELIGVALEDSEAAMLAAEEHLRTLTAPLWVDANDGTGCSIDTLQTRIAELEQRIERMDDRGGGYSNPLEDRVSNLEYLVDELSASMERVASLSETKGGEA